MNYAHLHLMVNHLPLFATLFGGALLAWGLVKKQPVLKSAGLVLGLVSGLGGAAAVFTGERAEDVVEAVAGTNEDAIHEHEEAAEKTRFSLLALGLVSLIGLTALKNREQLRGRMEWLALALFVVSLAMVAWTANLGGPIQHPELGAAAPSGADLDDDEHN